MDPARHHRAGARQLVRLAAPQPGPQALNRYSYVGNRPTVAVDPSGHCVPDECPGVPNVEYPGSGTGLRGEAYAQWLYNLILWIDREKAATGGVYNVTSNLIQETAAHELNSFLMDDPEILGDQFYQELMMSIPQLSSAAAGAGFSALVSGGGRVLGAVRSSAGNWMEHVPAKYQGSVANAFAGTPVAGETTQDITVYRHWGGGASETGSPWFSPKPYVRPGNAQRYLALPLSNSAQNISVFMIPSGTTVIVGKVAPQTSYFGSQAVGGGTQVYLPNPSNAVLLGPLNVAAP